MSSTSHDTWFYRVLNCIVPYWFCSHHINISPQLPSFSQLLQFAMNCMRQHELWGSTQEPKAAQTWIAQLAAAPWLPGWPDSLCFLAAAGRTNSRSCSQPLGHIPGRPAVGTWGAKALQPFLGCDSNWPRVTSEWEQEDRQLTAITEALPQANRDMSKHES